MATFNNGNPYLTKNAGGILSGLNMANTNCKCATCFADVCDRTRFCIYCTVLLRYIDAYTSFRGKTPHHAELMSSNQTWPPTFLTDTWVHFKRYPAIVKEKGNPGSVYDGYIESVLTSLMLQSWYKYEYFIFAYDSIMALFETVGKKKAVLLLIDKLYKIDSIASSDLLYNVALGTKSERYKGSLWSTRMLFSIFGKDSVGIFAEFNVILGNDASAVKTTHNSSHQQNFENEACQVILNGPVPEIGDVSVTNMITDTVSHDNVVPMNLFQKHFQDMPLDGGDDFFVDFFAISSPISSPTPEKIGLATVTDKLFINKTHVFDIAPLQYIVDKTNGGVYMVNGMVDLETIKNIMFVAAKVYMVPHTNLDVLCDEVYKHVFPRSFISNNY
jgi:hypothetical protein